MSSRADLTSLLIQATHIQATRKAETICRKFLSTLDRSTREPFLPSYIRFVSTCGSLTLQLDSLFQSVKTFYKEIEGGDTWRPALGTMLFSTFSDRLRY